MDRQKDSVFRMNGINYLVPFILITALFFLWGFARAILDVLNKHFQNEFNITIAQSALIQVTTYLGYFLMAIPAGIFINRWGYRRGVVFGLIIFGIGALSFVPASGSGFYAYIVCLFIIGCGLTFLETAANPYSAQLGSPATASSRLNLSQSFNGLGSLMATFMVGQFLFSNSGHVAVPYIVLGVLVFIIAVVFSRVKLPEIEPETTSVESSEATSGLRGIRALFRGHPLFVLGLMALLAYEVAEISINSYFINFVTGQGWMNASVASMVLTLALAFFMVGRFVGSWIMRRVRAVRLLGWCALGAVACMLLVLLNAGKLSMVALVAVYFFEAIMFPTIFSLAVTGLGSLTKSASSLLMMTPVGGCGFLLMGYVADHTNLVLPFVIPLLGYLVVLFYARRLEKK